MAFQSKSQSFQLLIKPKKVEGSVWTGEMFIILRLGLDQCPSNANCGGRGNTRLTANMNNVSFQLPSKIKSLLEAHFDGVSDLFADQFPDNPSGLLESIATTLTQFSIAHARKTSQKGVLEITRYTPP